MKEMGVVIRTIENITHDVVRLTTDKPYQFRYFPGQATEVSINKPGWDKKKKPFTFTSIPENDYLEFTIKTYPSHNGVTNEILLLKTGDQLLLNDVFGSIGYRGEGLFIAAGAGITPFISIFRYLKSKDQVGGNKLIFGNKLKADIINEQEFKNLLHHNFINVLSEEKSHLYEFGFITEKLIIDNSSEELQYYYLCGPPPMMKTIEAHLDAMNVRTENIIKESF